MINNISTTINYKTIRWCPDYYFGENGDIISVKKWKYKYKIVNLIKFIDKKENGYLAVAICCKNGIIKKCRVNRLICEAFHGPPPSPKYQACHNNGNKFDNRSVNLRWDTPKNNNLDKIKHGVTAKGEKVGTSVLNSKQVKHIREKSVKGIRGKVLAKEYSVAETTISAIIKRKTWKHI
jgi:hypothetical protein